MAKTPEEKKIAQAAAHKRWRESEKGKAYVLRKKQKASGITVNEQPDKPLSS
jgi:hypothetical protein